MTGDFAASMAGHDRGQIYVIIREEKEYVYLCDGKNRLLADPKRKNKKHIQIIKKHHNTELAEQLRSGKPVHDEQIKRAIKLYEAEVHKQI